MVDSILIGAAIVDIPLVPVTGDIVSSHYTAVDRISMYVGGDAANEAMVLSRLGHRPALVSIVGSDLPGDFVLKTLGDAGVDTRSVARSEEMDTGINIVMVDPKGERNFVTAKRGSLRRLCLEDILPALDSPSLAEAKIACLASMFVSERLSLDDTLVLFDRLKARGLALCADTTRVKKGETLSQAAPALSRLDYFFPNFEEAALLTNAPTPEAAADALLKAGVKHVVMKLGGQGCLLASARERYLLPALPGIQPIDTTGAGDTFAAAFLAALLEGKAFYDCGLFANAAASLCVESVGAVSGTWARKDVEERLCKAPIPIHT